MLDNDSTWNGIITWEIANDMMLTTIYVSELLILCFTPIGGKFSLAITGSIFPDISSLPRQDVRHSVNIFKRIFMKEECCALIQIPLKFVL